MFDIPVSKSASGGAITYLPVSKIGSGTGHTWKRVGIVARVCPTFSQGFCPSVRLLVKPVSGTNSFDLRIGAASRRRSIPALI